MSTVTPWQLGHVPGQKQALELKPETCPKLLKRAKRPLIIVGANLEKEGIPQDFLGELARRLKAPVVISPSLYATVQGLQGVTVTPMGIESLVHRLQDKGWSGLDGGGSYDQVVFLGGIYYFQAQMLSALKHFAKHLQTLSLDRFYHPNATYSFSNLSPEKWREGLVTVMKGLEA